MPGRYERDSLAVRRGVIMADRNHSSDSPSRSLYTVHTHQINAGLIYTL